MRSEAFCDAEIANFDGERGEVGDEDVLFFDISGYQIDWI